MGFVLSSFVKDISRWRQDWTSLLLWIAIPLLIGTLITSLMDQGDGAMPRGLLLIADQDDSLLSGLVASAYSQGQIGEMITVEQVKREEGTQRIDAGEASALLIIPLGFSDAFLKSQPIALTLRTNPAQTILPGIITEVTEILLDAGFYAHEVFGEEISTIQSLTQNVGLGDGQNDGLDDGLADGIGNAQIAALSVVISNKIQSVAPLLFPPVIELEIEQDTPQAPGVPLALLFLPGIILIAVLFAANGLASDYWKERDQGTLRRLVCSPGQLGGFVAGKALAVAVVMLMIAGLTLVIGFVYHGIAWSRLPSTLLWTSLSGVALFAWFAALQMLAANRRAANLISSMLLFPLLMAGGSFFPFAALPGWIASIGRKTPNGFVTDRLGVELMASSSWSIDAMSWLIVFAMAVAGLALCSWRLRAGFARS